MSNMSDLGQGLLIAVCVLCGWAAALGLGALKVAFDEQVPDDRVEITAKIRPFMFWLWFAAIFVAAGSALGLSSVRKTKKRKPTPRPASDDLF